MRMNKSQTAVFFSRVSCLIQVAEEQGHPVEMSEAMQDVERLYSIERQLQKLSERIASVEMTARQTKWNESRLMELMRQAKMIALNYKCLADVNSDPRCCKVWVFPQSLAVQRASAAHLTVDEWIDTQAYKTFALTFDQ